MHRHQTAVSWTMFIVYFRDCQHFNDLSVEQGTKVVLVSPKYSYLFIVYVGVKN